MEKLKSLEEILEEYRLFCADHAGDEVLLVQKHRELAVDNPHIQDRFALEDGMRCIKDAAIK
ncbi:MAG: hypothetical protein EOP56_09340 [Sphingobacteriales bacterium]|nr:MAG: hypothetical protein EOP56_09340 [Sphingobacteriales bacterium]